MKNYLIYIILFCFVLSKEETTLVGITYKNTQDSNFFESIKNRSNFNSYLTKNGTLISSGDTLILGEPVVGQPQYQQFTGVAYSTYSTVTLSGGMHDGFPLPIEFKGDVFIIDRISCFHTRKNKKSPLMIMLYGTTPNAPRKYIERCIFDFERAIQLAEIVLPNAPMSKQEAIAKLKESKDLLDLEIISQEEYDILKEELMPVIRGK